MINHGHERIMAAAAKVPEGYMAALKGAPHAPPSARCSNMTGRMLQARKGARSLISCGAGSKKLGALMDHADNDVLAFMTFPRRTRRRSTARTLWSG